MTSFDTTIEVTQMPRICGIPNQRVLNSLADLNSSKNSLAAQQQSNGVYPHKFGLKNYHKQATVYALLMITNDNLLTVVLNKFSTQFSVHEIKPLLIDLTLGAGVSSQLGLNQQVPTRMRTRKKANANKNIQNITNKNRQWKLQHTENNKFDVPNRTHFEANDIQRGIKQSNPIIMMNDVIDYNLNLSVLQSQLPEYAHFKVLVQNPRVPQIPTMEKLQDIVVQLSTEVPKLFLIVSLQTLQFPELVNLIDKLVIVTETNPFSVEQTICAHNLVTNRLREDSIEVQLFEAPTTSFITRILQALTKPQRCHNLKSARRSLRLPLLKLKQVQL